MRTDLYWIPTTYAGRLAIMPRPRGGDWLEDEISSWHRAGVEVVVSLLTQEEIADLGLVEEEQLCLANGIQFLSLPILDRSVPPSKEAVIMLVTRLVDYLNEGKGVAIHCRQGIGRAALIAAAILIYSGLDAESAVQQVSVARSCSVPETGEQSAGLLSSLG